MSSYRSTAAQVAETKRRHPELFCPATRCLWRTGGGRCPRHPAPLAVELAEMEARDPKLREAGQRIERFGEAIAENQGHAACGPCADARDLILTSGFPPAPCKFCGGPTGRRIEKEASPDHAR